VFTDSGGTFVPVIQEYYDLMPYGEVIDPPSVQESMLFTGKPRDTESGLDIFGARYYTPNIMRWSSPDSPFEDNWLEDPQSWNLFVYVRHNPVNRFDPNGQVSFGEVVDGVADFATGVARGMVASATYGLAPHSAPKETDSNSSIAGQFVGSTVAGMAGTSAVGTGLGMTGVGSIGGVIASPSGIGAVAGGGLAATGAAVAATGTTVAVGSVVNIVHLMSAVKREPSSKIRKDWEEATGEPWPKDTKTGKNQDVSHKKPLADGGSNKIDNVEPKPHDDHMKDHMNAGDFKRWGARSTLKNQENKTN